MNRAPIAVQLVAHAAKTNPAAARHPRSREFRDAVHALPLPGGARLTRGDIDHAVSWLERPRDDRWRWCRVTGARESRPAGNRTAKDLDGKRITSESTSPELAAFKAAQARLQAAREAARDASRALAARLDEGGDL
ncbi:hypothetical protein [Microbacterium sp.]|uniref:hypothetical protein n=1 Tax=Microbacterium sp. TaxID=51671 RepID=UPI003C714FE4